MVVPTREELSMRSTVQLQRLFVACTVAIAACAKGDNATTDSAGAAAGAMSGGADSSAMAAGTTGGAGGTGAATTMSDAEILSAVSASNGAEIASSKMAQQQGSNAKVKAFARQMITDHTAMQKQADQIVTKANITPQPGAIADSIDRATKAMATAMQGVRGAEFDRQYMDAQVASHTNTLAILRAASGMAQNAELKQMLTDAQPKVQAHLDQARQLQTAGGATAAAGSAAGSTGAARTGADSAHGGMKH
jgi:putative membrane protein